jgi:RNase H-like domain found in reverse transcriptase
MVLPFGEQNHSPLAFLFGSFKNAASRWPIVEKEAFAIVETVCRMEYLLMRPGGFHLFTESSVNLQPLWP